MDNESYFHVKEPVATNIHIETKLTAQESVKTLKHWALAGQTAGQKMNELTQYSLQNREYTK